MPPPPIEPVERTGVVTPPAECGESLMHPGTQLWHLGKIWHLQLGLLS